MSKRDEFKAFMEINKKAAPNIADEIYKRYLNLARTDYGLTLQEAEKILKEVGITVGSSVNYFKELKLNVDEIKSLSDTAAEKRILEAYHKRSEEVRRMPPNNPRKAELQNLLAKAKVVLIDEGKWKQHIKEIDGEAPSTNNRNEKEEPHQGERAIIKFRNGNEATSIPQLATLMEKNAREATDILYAGDLALGLAGAAETPFAGAARAVVNQFSGDRQTGLMAMVAILRSKIKMQKGNEASTPQQLARLIDQNWEEAKTLLYNGFIGLWLQHTNQDNIASTVQKVVNTYRNDQDIGLEALVQRLDPSIGHPELEVSPSEIDFGNMNSESQKTIQFSIKNVGRGFLHGDVRLESNMPGLQISNTEIQGDGVVTVKLDASALTAKQKHQASLVVATNGETITVPVSCYITYPIQNSIWRLAGSGFSLAAITLVTRLLIQQFGYSEWLATRLTGAGFTEWEQHWKWVEWFEWPWFEWPVYTLSTPGAGMEFLIAIISLGVGIFAYWQFFLKKKEML